MNTIRLLSAIVVAAACLSASGAENPLDTARHGATTAPASRPSAAHPARSGFLEERYDNGKLKSSYAVDARGVKSGAYTLFAEDGKRVERGNYKAGELDGARQNSP
jgi:hypothetical protein